MREDYYAGLEERYFLTFEEAKEQKLKIDFDAAPPAPAPSELGVTAIENVSLEDIVPYIDWVSQRSVILFVFKVYFNLFSKLILSSLL